MSSRQRLTESDFVVLKYLRDAAGETITAKIAEHIGLTRKWTTHRMHKLLRHRLISERKAGVVMLYSITALGIERLATQQSADASRSGSVLQQENAL